MIDLREISDLDRLIAWRAEVLEAVFGTRPDSQLLEANREYYRRNIGRGRHRAFIASTGGKEVGCGAVCFQAELPSPDNPGGRCAYIMNVYVRPEYRRQGIASTIVRHLIEVAKESDCGKIYLESTDSASHVYERLGFSNMHGMMKYEGRKN